MADEGERSSDVNWVGQYKKILMRVLDTRPSGMRQRLADALGANRSFISQITNPTYPVPVPARHVELIFDVCRFPDADRRAFLDAYEKAHPGRLPKSNGPSPHLRHVTLYLPDLGDPAKNAALDKIVSETATRMAALFLGHETTDDDDGSKE
jgi:hypothetical protein